MSLDLRSFGLAASAVAIATWGGLPSRPAMADASRLDPRPDLPASVSPLDPAQADELLPLIDAAQAYRGLDLLEPLSAGRQTQSAARATLASLMAEEVPPEEAATAERLLRMLGLWRTERGLTDVLLDVLSSEVAGYYDPEKDFLALVEGVGDILGDDFETMDEAAAERMSGSIWVHEIGHALQDQHFDLDVVAGTEDELLSDRSLARQALIEGDASLVMFSYVMGSPLERFPQVNALVSDFIASPQEMASVAGSGDALLDAPAFLGEVLVFPYLRGMTFCLAVRQAGGQKLLDHVFRSDPPRSTEQILHPEKWLEMRDDPVEITVPDFSSLLGGRRRLTADDLGELTTAIVLAERLGSGQRPRADQAAAGWGGDRIVLYSHHADVSGAVRDDDVLIWITEWDDEDEAIEMASTAEEAFAEPGWLLERQGTRLVLAKGLSDAERPAVLAAALAAPASRTPVAAVDLAALGITDADRPQPLDASELFGMLDDPLIQSIVGSELGDEAAELLNEMADDPAMRELMMQAGEALVDGEDPASIFESMDLEKLAQSPAIQKMRDRILAQQEAVEVTVDDDGVVQLGDTGFRLTLPGDGTWIRSETASGGAGTIGPGVRSDRARYRCLPRHRPRGLAHAQLSRGRGRRGQGRGPR